MLATHQSSPKNAFAEGSICVIVVLQQHDRSGRQVVLLDGESMGETKTDLRKLKFSYYIQGITDVEIKKGMWLLSPREDLGHVLEAKLLEPPKPKRGSQRRVKVRVRFDESGKIRLNENWQIYKKRPITSRVLLLWQKRMTDGAMQYYRQVLPNVIDSTINPPDVGINRNQINVILGLQEQILRHAIRIAESQEVVRLTSTQMIKATREILQQK